MSEQEQIEAARKSETDRNRKIHRAHADIMPSDEWHDAFGEIAEREFLKAPKSRQQEAKELAE